MWVPGFGNHRNHVTFSPSLSTQNLDIKSTLSERVFRLPSNRRDDELIST